MNNPYWLSEGDWYYHYGRTKKLALRYSGPFATRKECLAAIKERKAFGWWCSQPIKAKEPNV